MHLYALTLQKSSAINVAVYGNFSGPKLQEFAVARGRYLELLRVDDSGLVQSVSTTDVFGVIRSLKPFRLLGEVLGFVATALEGLFGCLHGCCPPSFTAFSTGLRVFVCVSSRLHA